MAVSEPALRIRTSSRTTFKRCPQRWVWSYVDGLEPMGLPNKNLWFGTGVHLALGEWYGLGTKRERHPLETWEEFCKDSMVAMRVQFDRGHGIESEWVDAFELGKAMLTEYLKEYGEDESWDFIATEQAGMAKIRVSFGSGWVAYYYTFDGVYRDLADGVIKLLETKTAATIDTGHLSLDDQAGSYWALANAKLRAMGLLGPRQLIGGVTYNFLRKAMPDERPRHPVSGLRCNKPTKDHYLHSLQSAQLESWPASQLKKLKLDALQELAEGYGLEVFGEESKTQPTPLFKRHYVGRTTRERNTQIRRIQAEAEWMHAVESGTLPVTKTPMATGNSACRYGCEFFLMCELHEAGSDWEEFQKAMFRKRDPWAEYKQSTEGE